MSPNRRFSDWLPGRVAGLVACVGALCCTPRDSDEHDVDPGLAAGTYIVLMQHRTTVRIAQVREGCVPNDFMEHDENLEGVDALDYWGHRFSLSEEPGGVRVISAGRDAVFGTKDDLLSDLVAAKLCQSKLQDEIHPHVQDTQREAPKAQPVKRIKLR